MQSAGLLDAVGPARLPQYLSHLALGHGRVGLVHQGPHGPSVKVVARRAEECRNGAAVSTGDEGDRLVVTERFGLHAAEVEVIAISLRGLRGHGLLAAAAYA